MKRAVALVALVLVLLTGQAKAAPCAPFEHSAAWTGIVVEWSLSDPEGPFVVWSCFAMTLDAPVQVTRNCLEAPWSAIDLRRLGDRSDTIRNAADPLAAWAAALKRYVPAIPSPRCVALLKKVYP